MAASSPPRRTPPATSKPDTSAEPTADDDDSAAPKKRRRSATPTNKLGRPRTQAAKSTRGAPISRPSNLFLPQSLITEIVAARTTLGLSTGQLVLTAVQYAYDQLAELLVDEEPPAPAPGGLFAGTLSPTSTKDTAMQCLNIRLLDRDYAVLDRLVAQFAARSRSHLITAALEHYLTSLTPKKARTKT